MTIKVEDQETEEVVQDETTEVDEILEDESEESEDKAPEAEEKSEEPGAEDEDLEETDEVIVTIGDEAPPQEEEQKAPEWVRELRKSHREVQRENRELKAKVEAMNNPAPAAVKLGDKPKLEDFDYDTEQYEAKLAKWYEQKREVDAQTQSAEAERKAQADAWQARLNQYGKEKSKLKVKDFDDAESVVTEVFDQTQQGIIIQGADNAALTIYALGRNSEKLKELSSIKDPVKFAFAVAKLETQLKVKNRKAPPAPERTVTGTAPKSGTVDSNLERLRAEAEKTGDYSKVSAYRRQQRQKAK